MKLTIVIPVFNNATTLPELVHRVLAACAGHDAEIRLVDDASRDDSAAVIRQLGAATGVFLPRNVGQNEAIRQGLAGAGGDAVVVMDADLQDPPEAIPLLLGKLEPAVDVVFGGRTGRYQSTGRMLTSRIYKRVVAARTGLPIDAGLFLVMRSHVARRLVEGGEVPSLVGAIGLMRVRTASVPVERAQARESSYSSLQRLQLAARSLLWLFRRNRRGAH